MDSTKQQSIPHVRSKGEIYQLRSALKFFQGFSFKTRTTEFYT